MSSRPSPSIDFQVPSKPLLRGVSHQIAALVALIGWVLLAGRATGRSASTAVHVYCASLFVLFAVSASYHRPTWSPRARLRMQRIDHSAIFLLIAGTYTPLCLLLERSHARTLLALVWSATAGGVLQAVIWVNAPNAVRAATYVFLGWALVLVAPALRAALGAESLTLLAVGGGLYTLGALIYATRKPDPFPRVFGYHEIFHLLVICAAACHFAVVASAIRALR